MPQQTNLNTFPYFDDFDSRKNYRKILFKPGYPVQARELTTLQSTLQNQIESISNFVLKDDGTSVDSGSWDYENQFFAVELENTFNGIEIYEYLSSNITSNIITGLTSGVTAKVTLTIDEIDSERGNNTLYVNYLDGGINGETTFADGELLTANTDVIVNGQVIIPAGEPFARTISQNATSIGSAVIFDNGTWYLRGYFIYIPSQIIILDQYENNSSYKIGFNIEEKIITSDEDPTLNDNANGFLNYAAPGSDRFSIQANLEKVPIGVDNPSNFVQIGSIINGIVQQKNNNPQLGELKKEFARRTYDESGDYYVSAPSLVSRETLNDYLGNNGVFNNGQSTYSGNTPSEDLGTYQISPLKAYVKGFEVETIAPTFLDFPKPRTTKTANNQEIIYSVGSSFTLNRVYGCPTIGISTSYYVSLRDSRVGVSNVSSSGKEIGVARVYDFALESGSYDSLNLDLNQWDISLYDIQTYTEISLNEPITLSTPTQIKGKSSGAVAFLRYNASNSGIITAYNISGRFSIGERLIFDGIENTRVSTAVTSYGISDIKSIYSDVGTGTTFSGDIIPSTSKFIGPVTISPKDISSGISTVTTSDFYFVGIATIGNLVAFSNPGLDVPTFATVTSVTRSTLTISGVTTVSGICDGALPITEISPSDFRILSTALQPTSSDTLYTVLPKKKVSSLDLTESNLTIRRQYDVTISSGSVTISPSIVSENETFLPYDEERYTLIRNDGTIEPLSSDKLLFNTGGRGLEINGLSGNGGAKLTATLRKINVTEKVKNKNRVKSVIISNSKYEGSGIGNTTLNDGLAYGNYPYGTRVQDEEICLLNPDVTRLYAVLESNDVNDPILPSIVFSTLTGPTATTSDAIIGERIISDSGQAIGIYVEKNSDFSIGYLSLNENTFRVGEVIRFENSGIEATISEINTGSNDITNRYTLINGQNNTIYGYSRIVRKENTSESNKRLKIIFESAEIPVSDLGDITTVDSYRQFDYCDLTSINSNKVSDIIDIRPRVAPYSVSEGARSPFEFFGRSFESPQNASTKILASDESILLSYSFYLPRIDKIFLTKDGIFQLKRGEPAEVPQPPLSISDAIEIGTISLPAYLCDINETDVSLVKHKRFRMSDIQGLEDRIKNLEYYTTLSLLEADTASFSVKDSNGLDRFKSGFFVDNFSGTLFQRKVTQVKNSIDLENSELRPTHYTTQLDLQIGSESLLGLTQTSNQTVDQRFLEELVGSGVKKTGQLLTLDYEEVLESNQPYATQFFTLSPSRSSYYVGSLSLFPASDTWVDPVKLIANTIDADGNYIKTTEQLDKEGNDPQTGFCGVTWNSWEKYFCGRNTSNARKSGSVNTQGRILNSPNNTTLNSSILGKPFIAGNNQVSIGRRVRTSGAPIQPSPDLSNVVSLGESITSIDVAPYIRSRNIEFTARRLKPFTRVYGFFDGVDVNKFISPKLLQINMISGIFQVGEKISVTRTSGIDLRNNPTSYFKVSTPNHKYGPYDNPTEIFTLNPYNKNTEIPSNYSESSTIINIDTYSMSNIVQGEYFGYVEKGSIVRGLTSGAQAVITSSDLVTDENGTLIGSFFIPNPNIASNPKFQVGSKFLRITSSDINIRSESLLSTYAEERYHADGLIESSRETLIRFPTIDYPEEPSDPEPLPDDPDQNPPISTSTGSPGIFKVAEARGSKNPRVTKVYHAGDTSRAYNVAGGSVVYGVTINPDGTCENCSVSGDGWISYSPGSTGTWSVSSGRSANTGTNAVKFSSTGRPLDPVTGLTAREQESRDRNRENQRQASREKNQPRVNTNPNSPRVARGNEGRRFSGGGDSGGRRR